VRSLPALDTDSPRSQARLGPRKGQDSVSSGGRDQSLRQDGLIWVSSANPTRDRGVSRNL